MLFTSYEFLGFLALLFLLYYILPKKTQWVLLLVASYAFYAFGGVKYLAFLVLTTLVSYAFALLMGRMSEKEKAYLSSEEGSALSKEARKAYRAEKKKRRFQVLFGALFIDLGVLAVVKYAAFAVRNVNVLLHTFGADTALTVPELLLPLGISFYTFQSCGYLIDVYRGKVAPQRNFGKFALFVSFFPQVIQGPISRYDSLGEQLVSPHAFSGTDFSAGLLRVLWGYFKKLVIADRIMAAITLLMGSPEQYRGGYVLLLILFYSIQIYADFTGGIDITIGVARALGIRLAENFDRPFSSHSTKEYWNRWHITMGSWFTDYVFYPLSVSRPMLWLSKKSRKTLGNAVGKRIPVYTATIVTWFLTGLWHGAGWNFIVWGLLNCLVILVSQELEPLYARFRKACPRLTGSCAYGNFCAVRTFLLMGLSRSLDCYRDVPLTFRQWGSMVTEWNYGEIFRGGLTALNLTLADGIVIALGCVTVFVVSRLSAKERVSDRLCRRPVLAVTLACLLLTVILLFGAYGIGYDATQFIYNQF